MSQRRLAAIMFADIAGYTAVMQKDEVLGQQWVYRFRKETETLVAKHDGEVVQFYGDGCLAIFQSAVNSLHCAIALQQSMLKEERVPVRIGLHSGDLFIEEGNVFGNSVNLASRVESLGIPGAVLFSERIWRDIKNQPEFLYQSMGTFHFKNVAQGMEVFAAQATDLIIPIPGSLRGKTEASYRLEKLPSFPDAFIGREHQLEKIREMLLSPDIRLVSLLGPGGIGKTRISVRIGELEKDHFPNGVCFVALDMVEDASLVPQYIANKLELLDRENDSWEARILSHLADKHFLLILDNLEQILGVGPFLKRLMEACPKLKMITTSRELLNLPFECEYAVDTMAVPEDDHLNDLAKLKEFDAIRLFLHKVQGIMPHFQLNVQNAPAILEICRYLEGLPLAIELAAARSKLFSPEVIIKRLKGSLNLLKSRSQKLSQRHQTLRQTIEWSYNLLNPEEQQYFQLMSMFPGGFTPEALESICPEIDVLEELEASLNKSLIKKLGEIMDIPRFGMLKMIREYGEDLLKENPNYQEYNKRFAHYYLIFAEENASKLKGDAYWMAQFDAEYENLTRALDWLKSNSPEKACRLGVKLWPYYRFRGFLKEGVQMLQELLALETDRSQQYAQLLEGAGSMAQNIGQNREARAYYSQALKIWQSINKQKEVARCLNYLGWAEWRLGNYNRTLSYSSDALKIFRELRDLKGESQALNNLGWVAFYQGYFDKAETIQSQLVKHNQQLRDRRGVAFAQINLAWVQRYNLKLEAAYKNIGKAIPVFEELKDPQLKNFALTVKSAIVLARGEYEVSMGMLETYCEPGFTRIGDKYGLANCLLYQAQALLALDQKEETASKLQKALNLFELTDDKWGLAVTRFWQGILARNLNQLAKAQLLWGQSLEMARQMEAHHLQANAYLEMGLISFAQSDWRKAWEQFSRAMAHRQLQSTALYEEFMQRYEPQLKQLKTLLDSAEYQRIQKTYLLIPQQITI